MLTGKQIAAKIRKLVARSDVLISRLGEELGVGKTATRQMKAQKYRRFLNHLEHNRIDLNDLEAIAHALDIEIDMLIHTNREYEQLTGHSDVLSDDKGSYLFLNEEDRDLIQEFLYKKGKRTQ